MRLKEECPKCGAVRSLFICSFGAVSCSTCMEFIRKVRGDEIKVAHEKFLKAKKMMSSEEWYEKI